MNLLSELKRIIGILRSEHIPFALTGGIAATLYRFNVRTTQDIDFLVALESKQYGKIKHILKSLSYEVLELRKADLEGSPKHAQKNKSTPIYMLCGRKKNFFGIDFLLPEFKWFKFAFENAQKNIQCIGDIEFPCITREDLMISKLYALANNATRFSDADDLKELFGQNFDEVEVIEKMEYLGLEIPLALHTVTPKNLLKMSKKIKKRKMNLCN